MVTYKPGIEYPGLRGVLARVRGFVLQNRTRRRTVRFALIMPLVLIVLCVVGAVVLGILGIPFSEQIIRSEYCSRCGLVRHTDSKSIVGIRVEEDSRLARTFLADWLERRRGTCSGHDWVTAAVSWDTRTTYGARIRASGGNGNPIWNPIYAERSLDLAQQLVAVLDRLEQVDAAQAMNLAEGLLREDSQPYWDWLQASEILYARPRELSESFAKTFESAETDDPIAP